MDWRRRRRRKRKEKRARERPCLRRKSVIWACCGVMGGLLVGRGVLLLGVLSLGVLSLSVLSLSVLSLRGDSFNLWWSRLWSRLWSFDDVRFVRLMVSDD